MEANNISENGIPRRRALGKGLEELTVKGTDNPYYCNLEENLKMAFTADNEPIYVCKDPVYDITYYVNYGRDNFIYVLKTWRTASRIIIDSLSFDNESRE